MTTMHGLTCREIVELVTDYLDGDLDADTTAALEAHLAVCPGCARYLDQIRETIATLGEISSDTLSAEVQSGLLQAFDAFRRPTSTEPAGIDRRPGRPPAAQTQD